MFVVVRVPAVGPEEHALLDEQQEQRLQDKQVGFPPRLVDGAGLSIQGQGHMKAQDAA